MASSNLPVQLTSFIGRQDDLRAIEQMLSKSRLVTLIGPGGSGKTRLALQVVSQISGNYADGAWLVELASLHEAGLVPQFVAQALGLPPAPDLPLLESLQNFTSPRQMLLILDNCEHLADACAELILQLLPQSPNLRILATSREALALELASARLNVLTIQEIASRLNDRFTLLTADARRGVDPRHHTLRATIDWSYDLLKPGEQALLRRMAVFTAGCTLDLLEAFYTGELLPGESTINLISSLVNKSLVVAETTGRAQIRYRLLETIRQYLLEKLEQAGEMETWRDRHLDLFLTRAEEAMPKLGGTYQQLWLNWLDDEHDNLRAALAWALASEKGSRQESARLESGLRIASALMDYWGMKGELQEGLEWFRRLLARADDSISLEVRVNAIVFASFLAMFLGDGPLSLGMALLSQGEIAFHMGNHAIARERWNESLSRAQKDRDTFRIAYSLNYLGDLARMEQHFSQAAAKYRESEALLRELDTQGYLASIWSNQGFAFLHLGEIEPAQAKFHKSMAIYREVQNKRGMIDDLVGLAAAAIQAGLPAAGARLLAAAEAISGLPASSTWPATQMEFKRYLDLARAKLTDSDFQAEQAAGRLMFLEQAVRYAQQLQLQPAPEQQAGAKGDGLTAREREVAVLVVQGKTNRAIAEHLVLSKRTVEKHIANILSKLGLTSRSQIVRWAIEQGLTKASG